MKKFLKITTYIIIVAGLTVYLGTKNNTVNQVSNNQIDPIINNKEAILKQYPELAKLDQKVIQTGQKIDYEKNVFIYPYDKPKDEPMKALYSSFGSYDKFIIIEIKGGTDKTKLPYYSTLASNQFNLNMYDSSSKIINQFIFGGSNVNKDLDATDYLLFSIPSDYKFEQLPSGKYTFVSSNKKIFDLEVEYEKK